MGLEKPRKKVMDILALNPAKLGGGENPVVRPSEVIKNQGSDFESHYLAHSDIATKKEVEPLESEKEAKSVGQNAPANLLDLLGILLPPAPIAPLQPVVANMQPSGKIVTHSDSQGSKNEQLAQVAAPTRQGDVQDLFAANVPGPPAPAPGQPGTVTGAQVESIQKAIDIPNTLKSEKAEPPSKIRIKDVTKPGSPSSSPIPNPAGDPPQMRFVVDPPYMQLVVDPPHLLPVVDPPHLVPITDPPHVVPFGDPPRLNADTISQLGDMSLNKVGAEVIALLKPEILANLLTPTFPPEGGKPTLAIQDPKGSAMTSPSPEATRPHPDMHPATAQMEQLTAAISQAKSGINAQVVSASSPTPKLTEQIQTQQIFVKHDGSRPQKSPDVGTGEPNVTIQKGSEIFTKLESADLGLSRPPEQPEDSPKKKTNGSEGSDFAAVQNTTLRKAEANSPIPKQDLSEMLTKRIVNKVAEHLEQLAVRRGGMTTIRLNPDNLGLITLTVKATGLKFSAEIHATNESVKQALNHHKGELIQSAQSRGLEMGSLNVGSDQSPAGTTFTQNQDSRNQNGSMKQDFERAHNLAQSLVPTQLPNFLPTATTAVDYMV